MPVLRSSNRAPTVVHVIRHGQADHNVISSQSYTPIAPRRLFLLGSRLSLSLSLIRSFFLPIGCPHHAAQVDDAALHKRDTALTQQGRKQAASLRARLQALRPTPMLVVTSPILRALQTTHGFLPGGSPSLPVMVLPDARERVSDPSHLCELPLDPLRGAAADAGAFAEWDWTATAEAVALAGGSVGAWERGMAATDLEGRASIKQRASRLSAWIEKRPESCLVLVSHGAFLMHLTGAHARAGPDTRPPTRLSLSSMPYITQAWPSCAHSLVCSELTCRRLSRPPPHVFLFLAAFYVVANSIHTVPQTTSTWTTASVAHTASWGASGRAAHRLNNLGRSCGTVGLGLGGMALQCIMTHTVGEPGTQSWAPACVGITTESQT